MSVVFAAPAHGSQNRLFEAIIVSNSNTSAEHPKPASAERSSAATSKPTDDKWADPTIPVGNAPPLPRWPLGVTALAWLAWVLFLVIMMIERLRSDTI